MQSARQTRADRPRAHVTYLHYCLCEDETKRDVFGGRMQVMGKVMWTEMRDRHALLRLDDFTSSSVAVAR